MTKAKTAPKIRKSETHRTDEELTVKLTPQEVAARSNTLAKAVHEISQVEEDKKAAMAEFAGKLKTLRSVEQRLASAITTKSEQRLTTVEHTRDFKLKRYTKTRLDTGEVIQDRSLLAHEAQLPLA